MDFYSKEGDFIKKINIVKKSLDFEKIIENGKFNRNKFISIYIYDNDIKTRFGISVSKKVGNAVVRNKIKRQIKNIIDINKKDFQKNKDYIIIIKKDIINLSYKEIEESIINIINKNEWRTRNEKKQI